LDRWKYFALCLALVFSACGYAYEVEDGIYEVEYEIEYEIEEVFFSGRTRQEYLDDLDFLYNTLVENFPFFGVIYRKLGVDMHQHFRETRAIIETTDNIFSDGNFANIVDGSFLRHARGLGHLNMMSDSRMVRSHLFFFSNDDTRVNFLAELNNPATRALHNLTDEDFMPPILGEESIIHAAASRNIQTEIIEEGRIAYVNIISMNAATMHLDEVTLLEFFHEVADYEHLIIDIRQNGGGDSRFFPELVVAPNISEPLSWKNHLFLMGGEHNRYILEPWKGEFGAGTPLRPINDMAIAMLPELECDDLPLLEYYFRRQIVVHPSFDSAIFGGKIWLLVSERVFSASEAAASMVKQTGFATLVGQTTGGDGVGFQPIVLALPNTGIVVRYSAAYGVDFLGRNNQEFGTEPCVFNMPGKDAMETVLYLIRG